MTPYLRSTSFIVHFAHFIILMISTACCRQHRPADVKAINYHNIKTLVYFIDGVAKDTGRTPKQLDELIEHYEGSDYKAFDTMLRYQDPNSTERVHWIYLPSAIGDEESIVLMAPQPYKIDGADHTLVARSNGKAEWLPQSFAISEIQRKAIAAKAVQ